MDSRFWTCCTQMDALVPAFLSLLFKLMSWDSRSSHQSQNLSILHSRSIHGKPTLSLLPHRERIELVGVALRFLLCSGGMLGCQSCLGSAWKGHNDRRNDCR